MKLMGLKEQVPPLSSVERDFCSLIISSDTNKVVGMIFAGDERGRYTLANPAELIESHLNVEIPGV